MLRKPACLFFVPVSVFLFYLLCAPINNPFTSDTTEIHITFKNSQGIHTGELPFTDTINNKIKFGITAYLCENIDSVTIAFLSSPFKADTAILYKNLTSNIDTLWDSLSFVTPGTRTIKATLYINNGTTKVYNGSVSIVSRKPEIDVQPINATVNEFGNARFTISASATNIMDVCYYSWLKNDSAITNATNDSLVLLHVGAFDTGEYVCRVVNKWGDTVQSNAAHLTIEWKRNTNTAPKWLHDTIKIEIPESTTSSINLADSVKDVDSGDVVALKLTKKAIDNDTLTGSIWKCSPGYTDSGSYTARIRAFDGYDSSFVTILVHVKNVNRSPVWETDKPKSSYKLIGGDSLITAISALDPDSDKVTYYLKSTSLPVTLTGNTLRYKTTVTDSTSRTIELMAKDYADSTPLSIILTVSPYPFKALTSFSFASPAVVGTINESAKTVAVTVPYGTNVSALVATFVSTGASVKVGSTTQVSGTTTSNFTNSVTYTVTAADGSTQDYVVTVTIASYVFTITFDGQSATIDPIPAAKTVTAPATTVGTLPTDPQKNNFSFSGWWTGTNGTGTAFTGSTTITQSMTVFAKWIPVYTIAYIANGGSGTVPIDLNSYQNGNTVTVLGTSTLSKTNYTFAGWNTQADTLLGTNYLSGATFSMGSTNVILYAKWRMNAPIVTTQPLSKTCPVNDSVTFTIAASGAGLNFQWQKNGTYIGGATTATYNPPLSADDISGTATYRCVVSNLGGSVTSNIATLSISTLTDVDGNIYHMVKIGKQVWTMENLRVTKYNDGTAIPKDTYAESWENAITPKYCYYNNTNNADSIKKFGALYNWYVVDLTNTSKIAPAGWHVPTDAEWDTLQNYLVAKGYNWDNSTTDNKIAKSMAAKTDWDVSADAGTIGNDLSKNNKSGFSSLPSGYRPNNGVFFSQGYYGYYWSVTPNNDMTLYAWFRYLGSSTEDFLRSTENKSLGFSVRLIRD